MSQPYVGEIRLFGFTFAPVGWAPCDGQLLSIVENQALFALIGTTFGGDGQITFGLPDLRGRAIVQHSATATLGTIAGAESVTLAVANLAPHGHPVAGSSTQTTDRPRLAHPATGGEYGPPDTVAMRASEPSPGSAAPLSTMPPYLTITPCISLFGIFPSRA